jgi:hypothetical protein
VNRLRKLSKLIYDKVKRLPWRVDKHVVSTYQHGKIDSPEVMVNGREYDIQMEDHGLFLKVYVRVREAGADTGQRTVYPGGVYFRWWPWAWERQVYRRVYHEHGYTLLIAPCDDVLDADIAALSPPSPGGERGALSLPPEKKLLRSPDDGVGGA